MFQQQNACAVALAVFVFEPRPACFELAQDALAAFIFWIFRCTCDAIILLLGSGFLTHLCFVRETIEKQPRWDALPAAEYFHSTDLVNATFWQVVTIILEKLSDLVFFLSTCAFQCAVEFVESCRQLVGGVRSQVCCICWCKGNCCWWVFFLSSTFQRFDTLLHK